MDFAQKTMAITGIGGFIGLRMAERAARLGMHVRGLDMSDRAVGRARSRGFHAIRGDIHDPDAARAVCEGADIVFHTAAIVEEDGALEEFRRVNVDGAVVVADAARKAGATRFIHLSSVMVYGFSFPRFVAEDGPLVGDDNPYCQTKIESEAAVMAFHQPGAMEVLVIRPGDVYGPASIPWVVRPLELMQKNLFLLVDRGRGIINHVHVENLLDGIFLALEKGATGTPFTFTDGEETTFGEFFGRLARMIGIERLRSVPSSVALPFFGAIEAAYTLVGKKPPVRPAAARFVLRPHPYNIDKARRLLDYRPKVPLRDGMAEIEAWLKAGGLHAPG
jgi:nucleoside-diphosphate-sugar epimerase